MTSNIPLYVWSCRKMRCVVHAIEDIMKMKLTPFEDFPKRKKDQKLTKDKR